jgi:hypothetical protein
MQSTENWCSANGSDGLSHIGGAKALIDTSLVICLLCFMGFDTLLEACNLSGPQIAIDHGKDQLQRLSLSARDHSKGDLALRQPRDRKSPPM